ncbi:sugar phosphate nucleotidyltransferase [Bacillus sp. B1-b2]|uniref:sugar phosphate nucleotidyltransferase n=1 Tax=Bacillus sp. B1-b2 TaxID=2653201 RepID=UPI001261F58C|nr:sugar phosphate nucleotidyltransferase [Bacillus sp. B1-b2]KAB7671713.1 cupin domain-containing protein [Bacillus sp. B1-b2]
MKLVLLSGGSGKRLWPLSNDARSKQFIKVLSNEYGEKESMVQRVWGQLAKNNLAEDSVIATSKSQVEMIHTQLGSHVPIVVEPERRDTFPAIALAAVYLYSIKGCSPNEVVAMLPVDPYVENQFFVKVKEMEEKIRESNADLALIGVKPTFPSEKYGYIVPSEEINSEYMHVKSFKEKPKEKAARKLIEYQALWNCGVFAFRLEYILQILIDKGLPIQYEQLLNQYHLLPKNSFDYEVVEKAKDIIALTYEGYWKDLGTWNTLTEEIKDPINGKGFVSEGLKNSHIVNELDIPITLIGLDNVVVAASPDGILVTDKESSPQVKDVLKNLEERPMYEERRWGWYKVLEHIKYSEGEEVLTKRICVESSKNLSYQVHYKRSEIWTVVKGEGVLIINDQIRPIRAGDVIHIPLGTKHALRATSLMEIIEVQTGSELVEEDIYRFCLEWDEIMNEMTVK